MLKRLSVAVSLALSLTSAAVASPLHATDQDYRGAITFLAAGNTTGASARYTTQLVIANVSNHPVYLRLELYSTTGYREGQLINVLQPGNGTGNGIFWGGIHTHDWELDNILGSGLGTLRVVAVHADGSEDSTATLRGYARLWMEPNAGGRMSEYIPGLTDYEASGGYRAATHRGEYWAPFIIDPKPFALDGYDTTYGGTRINIGVVNFDRDRDLTVEFGTAIGKDTFGGKFNSPLITITVPPGSVRQAALPLSYAVGAVVPPEMKDSYSPLTTQVIGLNAKGDHGAWGTFATMIDGASGASTFFLDSFTDSH